MHELTLEAIIKALKKQPPHLMLSAANFMEILQNILKNEKRKEHDEESAVVMPANKRK